MSTTILAVLGLAVLDTLSPALVGVTLYLLLAAPRHLSALLGTYLGTVAIAYFSLGVLLMLGLGAIVSVIDPTTLAWIQGILGVSLIVASYFIPDRDPEDPTTSIQSRTFSIGGMVILGLGTWLFEFYTAVPYFGAIGIMTAAEMTPVQWLPLLGVYVFIMIVPGIILFTIWLVLGDRIRDRLETWRTKLFSGSQDTVRWIVAIAGVLILLNALPNEITISVGQ